MSTAFGIIILAQVLLSLFVIWGFCHEDKFLRLEAKIALYFSHRNRRKQKAAKKLRLVADLRNDHHPDYTAA